MAQAGPSIEEVVRTTSLAPHERLLVMEDVGNGLPPVWGIFTFPYDQSEPGRVSPLFDQAYSVLRATTPGKPLTSSDLPIIAQLGRSQKTGVFRLSSDHCVVRDLEQSPSFSHIGFG